MNDMAEFKGFKTLVNPRARIIGVNIHLRDYVLAPELAVLMILSQMFDVENDNHDNYSPPSAA